MHECTQSEITQLRQRIQTEYEAAERGLSAYASGVSRHDFITARMENLTRYHEQLTELVGPHEAIAVLAQTIWVPAEQGTVGG